MLMMKWFLKSEEGYFSGLPHSLSTLPVHTFWNLICKGGKSVLWAYNIL